MSCASRARGQHLNILGWKALVLALGLCAASACSSSSSGDDVDDASAGDIDASSKEVGSRVYATVSGDDEVVLIDGDTDEVVERYAVGEGPAIILATPDARKLYTANWANDTVSAIDTATGEVTSIPMAGRPYVIAMPPAGDYVYAGLNPTDIAVIDTSTDEVVRTFDTGELAASLIVSPDGKTLYIATLGTPPGFTPGNLRAIDTETGELVHERIEVGDVPAWITIHPDGSRVYTLNFLSDDVTVVDTETWEVEATVDTGLGSQGIIGNVTPDGEILYVTNHGTAELMGIDTKTNEVVQTVPLDGRPVGVEFNQDGSLVYVTEFGPASLDDAPDVTYLLSGNLTTSGNGYVRAFDRETGEEVGTPVEVGSGPTSVVARYP